MFLYVCSTFHEFNKLLSIPLVPNGIRQIMQNPLSNIKIADLLTATNPKKTVLVKRLPIYFPLGTFFVFFSIDQFYYIILQNRLFLLNGKSFGVFIYEEYPAGDTLEL